MGINLPIGCVRLVSYEFFLFVDLLFQSENENSATGVGRRKI
jgi:hypothetical protein